MCGPFRILRIETTDYMWNLINALTRKEKTLTAIAAACAIGAVCWAVLVFINTCASNTLAQKVEKTHCEKYDCLHQKTIDALKVESARIDSLEKSNKRRDYALERLTYLVQAPYSDKQLEMINERADQLRKKDSLSNLTKPGR